MKRIKVDRDRIRKNTFYVTFTLDDEEDRVFTFNTNELAALSTLVFIMENHSGVTSIIRDFTLQNDK